MSSCAKSRLRVGTKGGFARRAAGSRAETTFACEGAVPPKRANPCGRRNGPPRAETELRVRRLRSTETSEHVRTQKRTSARRNGTSCAKTPFHRNERTRADAETDLRAQKRNFGCEDSVPSKRANPCGRRNGPPRPETELRVRRLRSIET